MKPENDWKKSPMATSGTPELLNRSSTGLVMPVNDAKARSGAARRLRGNDREQLRADQDGAY